MNDKPNNTPENESEDFFTDLMKQLHDPYLVRVAGSVAYAEQGLGQMALRYKVPPNLIDIVTTCISDLIGAIVEAKGAVPQEYIDACMTARIALAQKITGRTDLTADHFLNLGKQQTTH